MAADNAEKMGTLILLHIMVPSPYISVHKWALIGVPVETVGTILRKFCKHKVTTAFYHDAATQFEMQNMGL